MSASSHHLDHLPPAAAGLGYAVARPRVLAIAIVVGLTALGGLWLGLMQVQGPGALMALCRAQFGGGWSNAEFFVVLHGIPVILDFVSQPSIN